MELGKTIKNEVSFFFIREYEKKPFMSSRTNGCLIILIFFCLTIELSWPHLLSVAF